LVVGLYEFIKKEIHSLSLYEIQNNLAHQSNKEIRHIYRTLRKLTYYEKPFNPNKLAAIILGVLSLIVLIVLIVLCIILHYKEKERKELLVLFFQFRALVFFNNEDLMNNSEMVISSGNNSTNSLPSFSEDDQLLQLINRNLELDTKLKKIENENLLLKQEISKSVMILDEEIV
jgi:hypothetical protein